MKTILKTFGLPRTGTNLLYWLLTLNFKNYVAARAEHDQDYLGWKHGVPREIEHYLELEDLLKETVRFVFTTRKYESWVTSYSVKHFGSWENPSRFAVNDKRSVFCTPVGLEIYKNPKDLYDTKNKAYLDFCDQNPDRAMIVSFEDLTSDQEGVVKAVQDKFGLEPSHNHIVTIPKHINSQSVFVDTIA